LKQTWFSQSSSTFLETNLLIGKQLLVITSTKKSKLKDYLNQNENKGWPNFPNLDHETKRQEQRHITCETRIQQSFIARKNRNKVMIRNHTQN
jgi:hypothetical protein